MMIVEEKASLIMSDVPPPSPPQYISPPYERRQLPQSTIQAASQLSGDVVSGLGRSPLMLGVVVLNIIGIVAAVYFLNLLIHGQQQHLQNLLMNQQGHLKEIIEDNKVQTTLILNVHNREFDALMEMLKGHQPITGTQATPPPQRDRRGN